MTAPKDKGERHHRDLEADLKWLTDGQRRKDLSDKYLEEHGKGNRQFYANRACDFSYGITFVESSIAREWLERAIAAEAPLKSINPSNPMAVAENMKLLVDTFKELQRRSEYGSIRLPTQAEVMILDALAALTKPATQGEDNEESIV